MNKKTKAVKEKEAKEIEMEAERERIDAERAPKLSSLCPTETYHINEFTE